MSIATIHVTPQAVSPTASDYFRHAKRLATWRKLDTSRQPCSNSGRNRESERERRKQKPQDLKGHKKGESDGGRARLGGGRVHWSHRQGFFVVTRKTCFVDVAVAGQQPGENAPRNWGEEALRRQILPDVDIVPQIIAFPPTGERFFTTVQDFILERQAAHLIFFSRTLLRLTGA